MVAQRDPFQAVPNPDRPARKVPTGRRQRDPAPTCRQTVWGGPSARKSRPRLPLLFVQQFREQLVRRSEDAETSDLARIVFSKYEICNVIAREECDDGRSMSAEDTQALPRRSKRRAKNYYTLSHLYRNGHSKARMIGAWSTRTRTARPIPRLSTGWKCPASGMNCITWGGMRVPRAMMMQA